MLIKPEIYQGCLFLFLLITSSHLGMMLALLQDFLEDQEHSFNYYYYCIFYNVKWISVIFSIFVAFKSHHHIILFLVGIRVLISFLVVTELMYYTLYEQQFFEAIN